MNRDADPPKTPEARSGSATAASDDLKTLPLAEVARSLATH